ncbi:hypothetical protein ABL78_5044 [Leptomonas seymouri]|uniref:Fe2OG dioxygenase domain-containing protein n=1 Tax=Leptomonas seymouri TaxID=5684 RepID=A0A0N1PB74_LEPSE|nr:hypothetical protein ABL78_5044 [Leptomonas seymouri]|eukprot:KPI85912.1 hypothetical protein ABL78_5044 [Leptomonas seymouri]
MPEAATPTATGLPLPPLTLPPRQLKKIEISCRKWLTRFLLTLSSVSLAKKSGVAASSHGATAGEASGVCEQDVCRLVARVCPVWRKADGFVVLNGGILAGCAPHDVRATLLKHHFLQPPLPSSTETILEYASTLPFVLCTRSLALPEEADTAAAQEQEEGASRRSVLYVPTADLIRYAASTRAFSETDERSTSEADAVANRSRVECCSDGMLPSSRVGVVVLQLPPSASLWKGGSSTASGNRGCGFVYLLPCDVSLARTMLWHILQKPVVGIERLLRRAEHVEDVGECHDPPPRVCVSRAAPGIPGLYLVEDFLTTEEATAIWKELHRDRQALQLEYLSRRRVAHFNRRFIYGANQLTNEGEEVNARPSFYDWMRARLQNDDSAHSVKIVGDFPFKPGDYECDQLTVNYYDYSELGACGIATHVDAHSAFSDAILIVSLGSYTVMDFARWDTPAEVAAPTGVYLPPRSLAVMCGESRYGWTHCIAEKRTDTLTELLPTLTRSDRLSLTWRRGRTQRHFKAECPFPTLCDGE